MTRPVFHSGKPSHLRTTVPYDTMPERAIAINVKAMIALLTLHMLCPPRSEFVVNVENDTQLP